MYESSQTYKRITNKNLEILIDFSENLHQEMRRLLMNVLAVHSSTESDMYWHIQMKWQLGSTVATRLST